MTSITDERKYVKKTHVVDAEGNDFEVNHYADGDVMIKQEGTRDMVFIPAAMYDAFVDAMKRPMP